MGNFSHTIPAMALSIQQPWAWAIMHGKTVENRKWASTNNGLLFRGPFAVHTGETMKREDYEAARGFLQEVMDIACPRPDELLRGGIVGVSSVRDVVTKSDDPWFFGTYGLVLGDAYSCDFVRVKGKLGFFSWAEGRRPGPPPPPLKWMKEWRAT